MSSRTSAPTGAAPEAGLRARVLSAVDRTQRIAAMLDRWEAQDLGDEPDWEIGDPEHLAMRSPEDP